jgi:hypothetical protein
MLLMPVCSVPMVQAQTSAYDFLTNSLAAAYIFHMGTQDSSGNGNDSNNHQLQFVSDRFGATGGAAFFNGTNSFMRVSNSLSLNIHGNTGLTISVWLNTLDSSLNQAIVNKWGPGGDEDDQFWLGIQGGKFRFLTDDEPTEIYANTLPLPGQYYQVVAIYDQVLHRIAIFVNGKRDASKALQHNIRSTTQDLLIGNSDWSGNPFFGTIDDVRIYSRALSDLEVGALYDLEKNGKPWLQILYPETLLMHVIPGLRYQLETTPDLPTWFPTGEPFTAQEEVESIAFRAQGTRLFFGLGRL